MSDASRREQAGAPDRARRVQKWIAALLTALLHLLLVLLVMLSPPITVTPPQGAAAGSRMEVTYIDNAQQQPPATPTAVPREPTPRALAKTVPKASRLQTTKVETADTAVATEIEEASDTPTTASTASAQPPSEAAASPPAAAAEPMRRSSPMWGQPPGMLPQDVAPANAGMANSPAIDRGRGNQASSGADMEVGGYQVYYDLVGDTRLRAWRDAGMTELFLPLPGTRRLMVCPLEVALRRGSGKCRLVEPDSPELKTIGDAREVINMQRVYKLGEPLWSGPGAYR